MSFFTVTWKIENFSMCPQEELTSPEFTVPEVSNVKFSLSLYPNGISDYVSFYIRRFDQAQSSDITTFITYFITVNLDSTLSHKIGKDSFPVKKNSGYGYPKFISHKKLYKDATKFLPNDVLTLQVHICPKLGENYSPVSPDLEKIFSLNLPNTKFTSGECFTIKNETKNVFLTHCSFTTRIPVERRILNWNIEQLGAKDKSKEKMSSMLKSEFHKGIRLLLNCYVEGSEEGNESLRIDILRKGRDLRRAFIKCEVSFLDSSGVVVVDSKKKSEHVFGETYSNWSFSLMKSIRSSKDLITNDSLKMKFDFRISYDPQNVQYLTKSDSSYQSDFEKEILKMLKYEDTPDVYFECKNEKRFPAQKFIICARSPVFRAMFLNDSLEKQTGVIRMQDTDTTTVQHLRDYLQSDCLPDDLEAEEILKLYSVADKYNIEKLKIECAAFLKDNISTDNVREIIIIADMHSDNNLKNYANDFLITEMDFDSDVWKTFTKENVALTAETMRECLIKVKKASKK